MRKSYICNICAALLLAFIVVGVNYGECFNAAILSCAQKKCNEAVNLSIIGNTLFIIYGAAVFIIMRRFMNDAVVRSSQIIDDELGESDPIFKRDNERIATHRRELANMCMTLVIMIAAINQLVGVILAPRMIYTPADTSAGAHTSAPADTSADNNQYHQLNTGACAFKITVNIITHGCGALFVVPAVTVLGGAIFAACSHAR